MFRKPDLQFSSFLLIVGGSPGTPAFSTTKTGCHDVADILLKVALSTKNQSINQSEFLKVNFW
jgi:hypothetical protein